MSEYRFEIDACAGPATEALPSGASRLLVRVRMFNGPDVDDGDEARDPDVACDLRPAEARDPELTLLAAANTAETETLRANSSRKQAR
jgi:hypothetical protein